MGARVPSLEEYWEGLCCSLPEFGPEEQRVAVELYHQLAGGRPVGTEQLARGLGVPSGRAAELLAHRAIRALTYLDEQRRVLGFGGLAAAPMHHRFEVDGVALHTWCAWDSLFIPEILGRTARVTSKCPQTGQEVRLVVTPQRIERAEPAGTVVSFLLPDATDFARGAENVMANFCHFVFFLASREAGEAWSADHPGTFLYSLDEAFELARRANLRNFGAELARRHAAPGAGIAP